MDWMKTEKARRTELKKCEKEERLEKAVQKYSDCLKEYMNLRLWMEYGPFDLPYRNILWVEKIEMHVVFFG